MKTMTNEKTATSKDSKTKHKNKADIKSGKSNRLKDSKRKGKSRSSIVARISSFYTNMFAVWFLISLIFIMILLIGFNVVHGVYEVKPYIEELKSYNNIQMLQEKVNQTEALNVMLLDKNNIIIASSFTGYSDLSHYSFLSYDAANHKVFFSYPVPIFIEGEIFNLNIYYNITLLLIEILVIGAVLILIFVISILIIYIRGSYLTRKAFGVLDELIIKASNISSQNLNLRLNVTESIDELVEFALTFNRMMDRIESAYEKQNQFVSDASHELRTPIAVIQGYARMLERWGKDDKEILQESITAINKEAKAMQDLVEQLLFIARNDKDTLVLVKEKFDMTELMSELVRDTQMLVSKQEIISYIEPGVIVLGDRDRIKQALRIFVDNAIKYSPPD
ncbi:MAG: sensor histidine kinase, partial [Clostridiaceae bacterium]|nr:sensor histidine kinase [Clostridiaceae bacterium]